MPFGNSQSCVQCGREILVVLPDDASQGSPPLTPPAGAFRYSCPVCKAEGRFHGACGQVSAPKETWVLATRADDIRPTAESATANMPDERVYFESSRYLVTSKRILLRRDSRTLLVREVRDPRVEQTPLKIIDPKLASISTERDSPNINT